MKKAHFRYYEELNDFLPKSRRKVAFTYQFSGNPSIKEVISMMGVPHSQIDLIIVNGESVTFDYTVKDNDQVSVYPVFESIDITPLNKLHPKPLRDIKFILDIHLGRLTKFLRILGFDSFYGVLDDEDIIDCALNEKRIILTKDRGLLKNKKVTHGYWVREERPKQQLIEVVKRFDLVGKIQFLRRCLLCNQVLEKLTPEEAAPYMPPETHLFYSRFFYCHHCYKIYWEGTHYQNMLKLIELVK